ncbi:MAG: hypothetical protein ABIT04_11235 [Novosphingobium sp.]
MRGKEVHDFYHSAVRASIVTRHRHVCAILVAGLSIPGILGFKLSVGKRLEPPRSDAQGSWRILPRRRRLVPRAIAFMVPDQSTVRMATPGKSGVLTFEFAQERLQDRERLGMPGAHAQLLLAIERQADAGRHERHASGRDPGFHLPTLNGAGDRLHLDLALLLDEPDGHLTHQKSIKHAVDAPPPAYGRIDRVFCNASIITGQIITGQIIGLDGGVSRGRPGRRMRRPASSPRRD